MIRPSIVNEVKQAISNLDHFESNDFLVTTGKKSEVSILQIDYRFDAKFRFIANINMKSGKTMLGPEFTATVSPGEIAEVETITYSGKSYLISGIKEWLFRVHEELLAVPVYRQVDEQREELEELIKRFSKLPDEYFSKDEARDMGVRLDDLQLKLEENINSSIKNEDEANKKIKALQEDMQALKENLEALKKPSWGGALAVRVFEWLKEPTNRKILTTGAQVGLDLMLESGEGAE